MMHFSRPVPVVVISEDRLGSLTMNRSKGARRGISHFPFRNCLVRSTPSGSRATPFPNSPPGVPEKVADGYGKLPLRLEANRGQTGGLVKFLSRGPGYTLFLKSTASVLERLCSRCAVRAATVGGGQQRRSTPWTSENRGAVLRMRWLGANPASPFLVAGAFPATQKPGNSVLTPAEARQ